MWLTAFCGKNMFYSIKKLAKRFGGRGVKAVILHPQPGKEGFAERESTLR